MKTSFRHLITAVLFTAGLSASAQTIYICKGGDYTETTITDGLAFSPADGIDSITFHKPQMPRVVRVAFSDESADVAIPSFMSGDVACTSGTSTHVTLVNTNTAEEFTYRVSGATGDGSLTISASYKMTVELDGADIASSTGPALNILCGKRVNIQLAEGTTNTLVDAPGGSHKGCLYVKGHIELAGGGILNVRGRTAHAIDAGEYFQMKKSVKELNILEAVKDGIHCEQYFQMNGGALLVADGVGGDGVQVEYELDKSDQIIEDPENTASVEIRGGTIDITLNGNEDAKGIKADGDIRIKGGDITINAMANGSRGIQTDTDMVVNEEYNPTSVKVNALGGKCTDPVDAIDPHKCMGIKVDGNLTVEAGTIVVINTGVKSKGIKVGGLYTKTGGTVNGAVDNN